MQLMISRSAHLSGGRAARSDEGGYVAVMTALLLLVFMGFAAFAVDVGHWYLVGQQEQRAADAAAMAGVTFLPGDLTSANTTAQNYSKVNGFANGVNATTVTSGLGGQPTRLQVTVTQTVSNFFGSLLGVPSTAVTRTSIADYAGPVPLGSPCNEFGADPLPAGLQSTSCSFAGQFWANVGSLQGTKISGDAYQDNVCASGVDGCTGSTNNDYAPNGYFYTVTVSRPVANLQIQVFDPAMIVVGDTCTIAAANLSGAAALPPAHVLVTSPLVAPSVRYAAGAGPYCTGDMNLNSTTGMVNTQFAVHAPGVNAWDPNSWPLQANCVAGKPNPSTFLPYNGDLSKALDTTNAAYTARPDVAANFRQWVNLCTVSGTVPAGTYAVQVKTNGVGADSAGGHNRFSLRAFGSGLGDDDVISVAGFNYMALYANTPNGTTTDYLAKIPSGARGQTFNVRLFDVGDGAVSGSTIQILPPQETTPATFSGCTGSGPTIGTGALTNCQISVDSSYNGKWETISIPVASTYSCTDASTTGCWVRLRFFYGTGSTPNDTFSVTANINGDPVRIVQ
jgi:Flp pilus assembly protein TadG